MRIVEVLLLRDRQRNWCAIWLNAINQFAKRFLSITTGIGVLRDTWSLLLARQQPKQNPLINPWKRLFLLMVWAMNEWMTFDDKIMCSRPKLYWWSANKSNLTLPTDGINKCSTANLLHCHWLYLNYRAQNSCPYPICYLCQSLMCAF